MKTEKHCPKCRSTDLLRVPGFPTSVISGVVNAVATGVLST